MPTATAERRRISKAMQQQCVYAWGMNFDQQDSGIGVINKQLCKDFQINGYSAIVE
jgi:hypothetical protein